MEILRWALVTGTERRNPWLLPGTAGFFAVAFMVALCAKSAAVGRRREGKGSSPSSGGRWSAVKSKVMSAVRKGGFNRRLKDEDSSVSFLSEVEEGGVGVGGGAVSVSTPPAPVWQKKIIMGEKCALPNFSGLILYDEKGNALPHARKTTISVS